MPFILEGLDDVFVKGYYLMTEPNQQVQVIKKYKNTRLKRLLNKLGFKFKLKGLKVKLL